jgi:hypothetical protein
MKPESISMFRDGGAVAEHAGKDLVHKALASLSVASEWLSIESVRT